MLKTLLILIKATVFSATLLSLNVQADEFFPKADIKAGKALVDAHCIECHASKYGGDGSAIYTREYNKVKTSKGLIAQIRNCNTMLGLKWFEDEEINVAAYLNQTYYKLER
ncbi:MULTISPECIES: c-type cytochrome [Methylotenera]|uniref:c-type cytochrome n=1 Tax=Methylotenera TaxID=359407 RepID=UPI00036F0B9D|nr:MULTISPECIES: cytochrome c [Methylotenera]